MRFGNRFSKNHSSNYANLIPNKTSLVVVIGHKKSLAALGCINSLAGPMGQPDMVLQKIVNTKMISLFLN